MITACVDTLALLISGLDGKLCEVTCGHGLEAFTVNHTIFGARPGRIAI
jgi:hypothetical protein